jgi:hypothetical protein
MEDATSKQPGEVSSANAAECERLFLELLKRDYSWMKWDVTDRQLALIIDAMTTYAEQRTADLERQINEQKSRFIKIESRRYRLLKYVDELEEQLKQK